MLTSAPTGTGILKDTCINEDYTHTHCCIWNEFISSYKACRKSTYCFILNLMYTYEVKQITDMINRQTTAAHIRDVTLGCFSGFSFVFLTGITCRINIFKHFVYYLKYKTIWILNFQNNNEIKNKILWARYTEVSNILGSKNICYFW